MSQRPTPISSRSGTPLHFKDVVCPTSVHPRQSIECSRSATLLYRAARPLTLNPPCPHTTGKLIMRGLNNLIRRRSTATPNGNKTTNNKTANNSAENVLTPTMSTTTTPPAPKVLDVIKQFKEDKDSEAHRVCIRSFTSLQSFNLREGLRCSRQATSYSPR